MRRKTKDQIPSIKEEVGNTEEANLAGLCIVLAPFAPKEREVLRESFSEMFVSMFYHSLQRTLGYESAFEAYLIGKSMLVLTTEEVFLKSVIPSAL